MIYISQCCRVGSKDFKNPGDGIIFTKKKICSNEKISKYKGDLTIFHVILWKTTPNLTKQWLWINDLNFKHLKLTWRLSFLRLTNTWILSHWCPSFHCPQTIARLTCQKPNSLSSWSQSWPPRVLISEWPPRWGGGGVR